MSVNRCLPMRVASLFMLTGLISVWVVADDRLDPYERDEDISNTSVNVSISQTSDGLYRYTYSVESFEGNKGRILGYELDIRCDEPIGESVFSNDESSDLWIGNSSRDHYHAPVRVSADVGQTFSYGISVINRVRWGLGLTPGNSALGLHLLTPMPPQLRQYRLRPFMDVQEDIYNYDNVDPEDPDLPWIDYFTVVGMIEGPSCSQEADPELPPDDDPTRFAGSNWPPGPVNHLLTYSEPLRDKFHVPEEQETIDIVIHYHEDIDPATFRVQPGWARGLFTPVPGASERVVLRLDRERNRFRFEVASHKDRGPRGENAQHHSRRDVDVFEIRRPLAPPHGRERGRGRR